MFFTGKNVYVTNTQTCMSTRIRIQWKQANIKVIVEFSELPCVENKLRTRHITAFRITSFVMD